MSLRSGLEARFANRFRPVKTNTESSIGNIDKAGQLADDVTTYQGIVASQKESINTLFVLAEGFISSISELQDAANVKLVDNIPLPTTSIRTSYSKKLGYVKLAIEFAQAGLLHFMEQNMEYETALQQRDTTIANLARSRREIDVIGSLTDVELSDLLTEEHSSPDKYNRSEVTPPTTPKAAATKKNQQSNKK